MCSFVDKALVCILAAFLSQLTNVSAEKVCDEKTFRKSSLYSGMKPVENATTEMKPVSLIKCSATCHKDVMCTGFFFNHDDGTCSLFTDRFHSLSFVNQVGTKAYGKSTLYLYVIRHHELFIIL